MNHTRLHHEDENNRKKSNDLLTNDGDKLDELFDAFPENAELAKVEDDSIDGNASDASGSDSNTTGGGSDSSKSDSNDMKKISATTAKKRRSDSGLWIDDFMSIYAQYGSIRKAAKEAGVNRSQIAIRLKDDPEFAERVAQAREDYADSLEERVREMSETDIRGLFFLLKGIRPQYKDGTSVNVNQNNVETITVDLTALEAPSNKALPSIDKESAIDADFNEPEND